MYLEEYLKKYKGKKIKMFVDMDGVIVDYDFGSGRDFHEKRPLYDSIKKLEKISKYPNIELYILSATRFTEGIGQKNYWLNKYASFFKEENRIIISREENDMKASDTLKSNYLRKLNREDYVIIVIDDDPKILKKINKTSPDVVLLKDTVLVD